MRGEMVEMKKHLTEDNVEISLYVTIDGKITVRVFDVDAGEAAGYRQFPNLAMAEAYYHDTVRLS